MRNQYNNLVSLLKYLFKVYKLNMLKDKLVHPGPDIN